MSNFNYKYKVLMVFASIIVAFSTSSCFTVKYSTTGASISPDIKSVSMPPFQNRAGTVRATLSYDLTQKLREKIEQNTKLYFVPDGGDVSFEGEITGYTITTLAVEATKQQASKNRLTVTINVKFVNSIEPVNSFTSSFSRYEDFDSNTQTSTAENSLLPTIIDNLAEDIFNKAFSNW